MFVRVALVAAGGAIGAISRYLLGAWLPLQKMKVTGGQLRGDVAMLEVEGEMFPGTLGLSIVRMVKTGASWQFDRAARAGLVK